MCRREKKWRQLLVFESSKMEKYRLTLISNHESKIVQFRFYFYGRQHVSKKTLDYDFFKNVVHTAYAAGGGNPEEFPIICSRELFDWCKAELVTFT